MSRCKNMYLSKLQLQRSVEDTRLRNNSYDTAVQLTMDKVIITLGEMGFDKEFMRKFNDKYHEVEQDVNEEILTDYKDDPHIEYAFAKLDRALQMYVPEDLFAPHEVRYRHEQSN